MSFDRRLGSGMLNTARQLDQLEAIDVEAALSQIPGLARRQKHSQMLVLTTAALVIALAFSARTDLGDFFFGIETHPPANEGRRIQGDAVEDEHEAPSVRGSRNVSGPATRWEPPRRRDLRQSDRSSITGSGIETSEEAPSDTLFQGPQPTRSEIQDYTASGSVTEGGRAACVYSLYEGSIDTPENCVSFEAQEREKWLHISIEDDTSKHVSAWIAIDPDGYVDRDDWIHICDTTDSPIEIEPRAMVAIYISSGECQDGESSAPTTGSVTAVFYR